MLTRERFLKIRETVIGAIDKLSEDEANALADILEISSEVMEASNTRPAAPIDGLETVGEVSTIRQNVSAFAGHVLSNSIKPGDLLCLKSQAVAIIAAERSRADQAEADAEKYREYAAEKSNQVAALQQSLASEVADNAALTAKLKTANALVTCCCGNQVDSHGIGDGHSPVDQYHYAMMQLEEQNAALTLQVKELDDECNKLVKTSNEVIGQRDHAMNLCAQMEEEKEILETQLSAAGDKLDLYSGALNRAVFGFDQIHKSLMSNGPKQASGEVAAFFLAETNAALEAKR